ncbi:MAG: hypothetical protein HXY38_05130 [Chloroflexi bacterium]|nr:hypothetical protein [Chloroflexota bacterium]
MSRTGKWALGMVLTAAAAFAAFQTISAPLSVTETTSEPYAEQAQPCSYRWAYQDMPELSAEFNGAIQSLNPDASGYAQAFGEECAFSDGLPANFSAMETDFHVALAVEDLKNEEEFGNWLAQVMGIVLQIPKEHLLGPNPGFVEFSFEKNPSEQLTLRVPIQKYNAEGQGKTGAVLFQLFYTQP